MQTTLRIYGLAFLALFAFAVPAAPAQAEERQREVVPEANVYVDLSDRTRLFLLADVAKNLTENTAEAEYGIHLDFTLKPIFRPELHDANWERKRYFWTRIGYVQLDTPDKAHTGPTERRGILELTGRIPLPQDVWLVPRVRADLRDLGGEYSRRYRFRLGIERELTVSGVVMVPYVQPEFFYDTRFDRWNRQLYQAGVEIELSKHWRIEPYLARQNDDSSTSGNVSRAGVVLKYYH